MQYSFLPFNKICGNLIFDIKKFAIHDGPGIRTAIFFTGCPLNCWWCHNPECKSENSSRYSRLDDDSLLRLIQTEITKDIVFYDESGGGVTFSGGEPMMHTDFLSRLLNFCKAEGIRTAVDTCGYADFEEFTKIIEIVDLFLFDIKLIDDEKHIKYTGVSNESIFENLEKLSGLAKEIYIRIPLIPNITDNEENLLEIAKYLSSVKNISRIDLLPFNMFGKSKYRKLNIENKLNDLKTQTEDELQKCAEVFKSFGLKVHF